MQNDPQIRLEAEKWLDRSATIFPIQLLLYP